MTNQEDHDDLQPTMTEGYKPGQKRTAAELANLDAHDESLNRWKASLGINAAGGTELGSGPKVSVLTLFLVSSDPALPGGRISVNVSDPAHIAETRKNPITIKEGVEYNVGITFKVNHSLVSGVRYIHVVKRAGIKVDKLDQMLGSYGPAPQPYTKNFPPEEAPSGLVARSGTYVVTSRVVDDDNEIYAEFQWSFKIGKEW